MTTNPCRFFLAGNCRNGASCRFYHEGFDSLPPEILAEAIASEDDEETTTSTTTTRSQIRTGAASSSSRPSFTTPRPCHWYMAGYCHRGESCWFSHDRSHVNPVQRGNGESTTLSDNEETTTTTEVNRPTTTYNSDDEEDQKCAICFEVPTTFGLLGRLNTTSFLVVFLVLLDNGEERKRVEEEEGGGVSLTNNLTTHFLLSGHSLMQSRLLPDLYSYLEIQGSVC